MADRRELPPFIVPSYVRDAGLHPALFRVLAQIVSRCGDGGECYESVNSMANAMAMDRRVCMRCLDELKDLGLIMIEKRNGARSITRMAPGWQTILVAMNNRCTRGTGTSEEPVPKTARTGASQEPPNKGVPEGVKKGSPFARAQDFPPGPDLQSVAGGGRKPERMLPLVDVEDGRAVVQIEDDGLTAEDRRKREVLRFTSAFKTQFGRWPEQDEIPAALRKAAPAGDMPAKEQVS